MKNIIIGFDKILQKEEMRYANGLKFEVMPKKLVFEMLVNLNKEEILKLFFKKVKNSKKGKTSKAGSLYLLLDLLQGKFYLSEDENYRYTPTIKILRYPIHIKDYENIKSFKEFSEIFPFEFNFNYNGFEEMIDLAYLPPEEDYFETLEKHKNIALSKK